MNSKLVTPPPAAYVTAGPIDWPGNRVAAAVYHVDGYDVKDTARLIAAAPDLLAACQYAAQALSSARFDTAAYDPHVTAVLNAIAKATHTQEPTQ
jgi:hypothetical protein